MLGVQRPLTGGSGDTKLGMRLLLCKQVCHRLLQGYADIGCVGSRGASQDCGFSGTLAPSAQGTHSHTWGCFKCTTRVQILSQSFASLQPQAMYLLPFVCFYLWEPELDLAHSTVVRMLGVSTGNTLSMEAPTCGSCRHIFLCYFKSAQMPLLAQC